MYLLIYNPFAAHYHSKYALSEVLEYFDAKNLEYELWTSQYPKHTIELANDAINKGYKNIISVGGDGTLLEIAGCMAGSDCTLGIIPAGTGNDFAMTLYGEISVKKSIEAIVNGKTKLIDIGKTSEDTFFMNVAGTGFDTDVIKHTERYKKFFRGQIPYLLGIFSALISYKSKTVTITTEDTSFKQKVLIIAVANGKTYGGGMKVAPNAEISDGLFEITLIDHVPKIIIPFILPRFVSGKHENIKQLRSFKCKQIKIECDEDLPINMDGEIIGTTPKSFEIQKHKISVFVP